MRFFPLPSLKPTPWRRLALAAMALGLLAAGGAGPAQADQMPQYQGVYIRMRDGTLVRLPALQQTETLYWQRNDWKPDANILANLHSMATGGAHLLPLHVVDLTSYASIPVIESTQIKSIVINGRSPSASFIDTLVEVGPGGGMPPDQVNSQDKTLGYKLTLDNCGDNVASNFNVVNIDAFNTELLQDSREPLQQSTINGISCQNYQTPATIIGRVIETNEGNFIYLDANGFREYLQGAASSIYNSSQMESYNQAVSTAFTNFVAYTGQPIN